MTDRLFMEMALELAARGKGFTSPNPCVGAVVVKAGEVIGQGWHQKAGTPHAEVNAIDDAIKRFPDRLAGATIYVTLEPCNHFGKTPPCTHKILENGITRVVVGCTDPNPGVSGGGNDFLRDKGLAVESGVLEARARDLIEDFIWTIQNDGDPFVTLKCATTLDGRIATRTGDSQWITGPAAREKGHELRHQHDAILIGSGTLRADNPSLTTRIDGRRTKDPVRVVLDTRLTIEPDARVINPESSASVVVAAGPDVDPEKAAALGQRGVKLIYPAMDGDRLDLRDLMLKLKQMSVTSLLIEGGGQVASSALKAGIVNKVCWFMAPKFLGGSDGIPVFGGRGPAYIRDAFELKRTGYEQIGQDIMVTGYLDKGREN
jgi:diaminohydroxyphosphoribosylaminopyrimidine deaminase/5-amino-6-(5-phosphoribosylamino)uracil reductase